MADSPVFEWLSNAIVETTPLSTPEARGTVRLALKDAGLDPKTLDQRQAHVVIRQLLPKEFQVRGIEEPEARCQELESRLEAEAPRMQDGATPEAVFERLAR